MNTYTFHDFDLLFKDLFYPTSQFSPTSLSKPSHPLNIFYDEEGLHFEIACTGLTKNDVEIKIEEDLLKINYEKPEGEKNIPSGTIVRSLSKKSFNIAYKISSKYDIQKIKASLENGLLEIFIPISEKLKSKVIKIN